ncbi:MAG: cation:proton antiporter [Bacteriovoracaceae bacterium]|nr:cation:proton antiporter [Bacteriovoracaceae bacterium]
MEAPLNGLHWPLQLNILAYTGIIFLLGQIAGRFAHLIRLPRLIGYLTIGIVLGPSGVEILSAHLIDDQLSLITEMALALIAFSIGGALDLKNLTGLKKSIIWITITQSLGAFMFVFFGCLLLLPFLPVTNGYGHHPQLFLTTALLFGAISVATAPAAVLSLIHELKARGPFTSVVLGVVALDDAFALIIYAFASVWAKSLIGGKATCLSSAILTPVYSIGVSCIIGILMGMLLTRLIRYFAPRDVMLGLILGAVFLTAGLARSFGVSLLLSSMVLGFIIINFGKHKRAMEAHDVIEKIEEPLFGVFFLLAGAHLNISIAMQTMGLSFTVIITRFIGKYLGTYAGAQISQSPSSIKKYMGLALLPSAGVAIGLTLDAKYIIEAISPKMAAIVVSAVVGKTLINEFVTPFLVRYALIKTGETDQVTKTFFAQPLNFLSRMGNIIHQYNHRHHNNKDK